MIDRRCFLIGGSVIFATGRTEAGPLSARPVRRRPPNALLESHRREALHWQSDIVEGHRKSVIGLSFVGCSNQCPVSDLIFQLLDAQAPPGVDLYTLTLMPLANDWRVLAERADELQVSTRWRWLTGKHDQVFAVLDALNISYSNPDNHTQTVLLTGRGKYDRVDADRPELLPSVDQLVAALS